MSYRDEIKKAQQLPFADLYEIAIGGDVQRYTSYRRDVTYLGNSYSAATIQSGGYQKDNELKSVRLRVTIPLTTIATQYVASSPVQPARVKITRVFIGDDSLAVKLFEGDVINVVLSKGKAEIEVESSSLVYRCKAPWVIHQAYCNNTLFDAGCTLLADDYKETAGGVTVAGKTITAAIFDTHDDGYYTLGRAQTTYGDQRLITNHVGTSITLHAPFDSRVATGSTIYVWPGCDKSPATCKDKFDNLENFVGFPYIPSHNPVIFGLERTS